MGAVGNMSLAIEAVADVIGARGYSIAYDYARDLDVIVFETPRGTPLAKIEVTRREWQSTDDWPMLIAHHVDLELTPKSIMHMWRNKDRDIRELVEARAMKMMPSKAVLSQQQDAGRQMLGIEASERLACVTTWRANHGVGKEPTDDSYPPDMTHAEWLGGTFVCIELVGGAPLVMEYVPNGEDDDGPTALYVLTMSSRNQLERELTSTRRLRYHSVCVMRGKHVVRTNIDPTHINPTHTAADVMVEVDVETLGVVWLRGAVL